MIKVAVIEDNDAYRQALHHLLTYEGDIKIVYTADSCNNITKAIEKAAPDVVIMDIEMPGIDGIEGVRRIKNALSEVYIFMLTTFDNDERIFDSIKAGAIGYLLKSDPPEEIVNALRKVYKGETVMNGKIARKVLQYFTQKETTNQQKLDDYNLTSREKEILELLMKGLSYKKIASTCFISNATVFTHVRKIYSKLNVHSRAEISNKFQ